MESNVITVITNALNGTSEVLKNLTSEFENTLFIYEYSMLLNNIRQDTSAIDNNTKLRTKAENIYMQWLKQTNQVN